jgi:hypothetical protein
VTDCPLDLPSLELRPLCWLTTAATNYIRYALIVLVAHFPANRILTSLSGPIGKLLEVS